MDMTFFESLQMRPYNPEISFDTFACSLNEWFMYDHPSVMEDMLPWDGWVMWI